MNRVKLVALSHYPDLFDTFGQLVETYEPEIPKILVKDGELLPDKIPGWSIVHGLSPFSYARNVNLGWTVTGNADVILCGDDIQFGSKFVEVLQNAAYRDSRVGVATVQLHGNSPFVCGYWKRSVLDAVGKMDEQFTGYGYDDNDYCHRMELAGFYTLPVEGIVAKHGGGSTFYRRQAEGALNVQQSCDENRKRYNAKWGAELK